MNDLLAGMAALCRMDAGGTLPCGLFLAGLAGGVLHCAPMCGPFVLGQTADRMARLRAGQLCEASRLRGGLLLPYHAGRLGSYALLGAVAGTGGFVLPRGFTGALLALAALLFALQALRRLRPRLGGFAQAPRWWVASLGRVTQRIDRGHWAGGLLLGAALGFLPCGMLYAALLAAAASGGAWRGAGAMFAFGSGTVPMLVVVALAGHAAGRRWQGGVARLAPAVMLLNAVVLSVLALAA